MILRVFVVFVLTVTVVSNVQAQYQFDVKTKLEEKHKLQIVKAGLLHAIETSSWASVGDIGEDYSLWFTDLRRVVKGDSMYVVVTIELRTKAMFTRGTLLHGRDVGIRYHWEKSMAHAGEGIRASVGHSGNGETGADETDDGANEDDGKTLRGVLAVADGLEFEAPKALRQITPAKANTVVGKLAAVAQNNPSPVEMMEALLIGDQALQAVKNMIK